MKIPLTSVKDAARREVVAIRRQSQRRIDASSTDQPTSMRGPLGMDPARDMNRNGFGYAYGRWETIPDGRYPSARIPRRRFWRD